MTFDVSIGKGSCFIAGALLPTIAYFLLLRNTTTNTVVDDDAGFESESESDDEFEPPEGSSIPPSDAKKWGIRDAPYKMVLCVNKELKMGKGKIAAQCCHAAVGSYKRAMKQCPSGVLAWERTGCAKVAVQCPTEAEMKEIQMKAYNKGIPMYLVEDAGRTQIAAGSRTVLGIGPAPVSIFEDLTSHLKLM